MDTAHRNQSRRIGRTGYSARPDQRFKPDILCNRVGNRNAESLLQLMAVLGISQESSGRFAAFLLQALQREDASVVRRVGKKGDGCVILSNGPGPAQTFVSLLFARKRIGVQERLHALPYRRLALAKIKPVLKQRYPGVRCRA